MKLKNIHEGAVTTKARATIEEGEMPVEKWYGVILCDSLSLISNTADCEPAGSYMAIIR